MVRVASAVSSLLFLLTTVTSCFAIEQSTKSPAYSTLETLIGSNAVPNTSPASLLEARSKPKPKPKQFKIQAIRTGRRYQSGKRYWAFSGGDAIIVNNSDDAAWFYLKDGQLKSGSKFVTLDRASGYAVVELSKKPTRKGVRFGKDKWGNIDLTGKEFSFGQGHGSFCVSGDGNVFVIASKQPPFPCVGIGLRPKVSPRHPGKPPTHDGRPTPDVPSVPAQPPPHQPDQPDQPPATNGPPTKPDQPSAIDPPTKSWTDHAEDQPHSSRPPSPDSGDHSDPDSTPDTPLPIHDPPSRGPDSSPWQDHRPNPPWHPDRPSPPDRPDLPGGPPHNDNHHPGQTWPQHPDHADPESPHHQSPPNQPDQPPPPWQDHNNPPPTPTPTQEPEPDETEQPPWPDPSSDPDPDEGNRHDDGHGHEPGEPDDDGHGNGPVYWGDSMS